MKTPAHILFLAFLLSVHVPFSFGAAKDAPREKYNFNSDWKLYVGDPAGAEKVDFDDAAWKNITTPHAWNEDDAFRKDIKDLPTGIAWYRKHFRLPADSSD